MMGWLWVHLVYQLVVRHHVKLSTGSFNKQAASIANEDLVHLLAGIACTIAAANCAG